MTIQMDLTLDASSYSGSFGDAVANDACDAFGPNTGVGFFSPSGSFHWPADN